MLTLEGYIEQSLRINLFFLRISKEHSFFLESSFTQRNTNLKETAGYFRRQFKLQLQQAVSMADGVLDQQILQSGQIITIHTLSAELLTQKLFGTVIDTALTKQEETLRPRLAAMTHETLEPHINELNRRAIASSTALAEFIGGLINDVKTCRLFINMYPLLMDHMLQETNAFIRILVMLQNRMNPFEKSIIKQEPLWNRILGEHAIFTGLMLDPTEQLLKNAANRFAQEFYALADAADQPSADPEKAHAIIEHSHQAAKDARDFYMAFIQGQLHCQILSVLIPLVIDHNTRETNYYIYQIEHGSYANINS